jgi:hypothetical protein
MKENTRATQNFNESTIKEMKSSQFLAQSESQTASFTAGVSSKQTLLDDPAKLLYSWRNQEPTLSAVEQHALTRERARFAAD